MNHLVAVGAGQAGQALVTKLRTLGFTGKITLIGEEPVPPYQRPPLSKAYVLGDLARERLFLRPEEFYGEHDIDLRLGTPVTGVDAANKTITLGDEVLGYDALVLTTGAAPNNLPTAMTRGVGNLYTVRTLADADAIAGEFKDGARVLIIGGGYIGLEAAAVASKKGVAVTLVELSERILQRVAAPETSTYFRKLHCSHGVDIREGVGISSLAPSGSATLATFSDGSDLEVDFTIVGVGVTPATALAEMAGVEIENGIKTDSHGRTSDPAIWAAGDCASFPYDGTRIRLESVGNAIDQAELVAENIMGADKPYAAKPWFWSDQYETKLQIAGLNTGYDRVVTRPGEDGAVSFWYFKGAQLLAVDAMNDPRAYMVGKRLIEAGKSPDAAAVADTGVELKTLLAG